MRLRIIFRIRLRRRPRTRSFAFRSTRNFPTTRTACGELLRRTRSTDIFRGAGRPRWGRSTGRLWLSVPAGGLPFSFFFCIQVLRNIRVNFPAAWQLYGFVDAFNPLTGWFDNDVVGIDVGIMALMAENQRTGFVWQTFMENPEAVNAMTLAGFTADA